MNDIDQRCDAYLAWLDDKRRTKEPILNELHVVSAATQAIMAIAGVGVNPITIVGIAFGLASDTFMNIRSRLLLEVDKSTVETVVITGQNRYRIGLTHVVIDTRVAAVYALRSYLRICTPFTIENQINTTVALFERGAGPIAESNPLIDPAIVRSTIITDINRPIVPLPRMPPNPEPGLKGDYEKRVPPKDIRAYRKFVCLDEAGGLAEARDKILEYLKRTQKDAEHPDGIKDPARPDQITVNDGITLRRKIREGVSACGEPANPK